MAATTGERTRYVGTAVPRVEDPRFLTGRAQYVDDVHLPNMLHAAFVRSPHAHARIVGIDAGRARSAPGVVLVVTGEDLRDDAPVLVSQMDRPESRPVGRRILPIERVRYVGEAVVAVVAASRAAAEDARELVEIEWEPLPAVVDAEAALAADAPVLHDDLGNNNAAHAEFEAGDVEQALAESARVFSKRFHAGRHHAAPLEGRAAIVDWKLTTGEVTMWSSSQMPHLARMFIAPQIGVPERKLRVIAPAVGGGFGSKSNIAIEEFVLFHLARRSGRPVKWIADRYEELASATHAKEMWIEIDIGVDENGRFTAFRARYAGDGGAYSLYPWTSFIDPLHAATLLPSLYDVRNVRWEVDAALTNKCWAAPYRGVGMTSGHTARELLIDEAARELDVDPVELRVRNCIPSEPYTSAVGMNYDGGSYVESIRRAQELVGYEELRGRQRGLREQGRYLGVGVSPFVEPTGFGSDVAKACGLPAEFFDAARVTVEPDGSVNVSTGLHSHGQGHETTFAQVAADALGVELDDVKVSFGDTGSDPFGSGTYASRSAVVGGGAVMRASRDVREKLLRLAAHAMEANPDDMDLVEGRAFVKGAPQRAMTVPEIAGFAYFGGHKRPAELEPALTATRSYDPPETYANGVVVAVVEVDVETGVVHLLRVLAVEDCGVMLNPLVVDGQVAGAIAQGIGAALYEECVYDETGQLLTGTLMDYLYPTTMEVPTIEIEHIETPSPRTEGGIKGLGEGGTIAAPAAVVNAVADALAPFGVRIERTPVTPAYVLELLDAAGAGQPVSTARAPRP
jgi:carbon-monoxide dehydrogenase large subunit